MIEDEIRKGIKENKIIFGYKKVIKALKQSNLKLVILASNVPENIRKDIEYNSKLSGVKLKVSKKTNKDLGVLCGKPFSVSVLGIKG